MQKKKQTKTKNPQNPKPPNHREDSSMGILTEVIKWLTENFFSYDLTFGQKSDGDIWRVFQVFRVLGGMEFSKHNTTFRLNSANLIS